MTVSYEIGDLVHIPQATELIDCEFEEEVQEQLTIPLRLVQTNRPEIGVISMSRRPKWRLIFVTVTSMDNPSAIL